MKTLIKLFFVFPLSISFSQTNSSFDRLGEPASLIRSTNWVSVGSLQNWFSSMGSEIEEGFVQQQQYGLQWPAIRPLQDIQVSKGLWIGTTSFADGNGQTYPHKVVHIGPRSTGNNEFIPLSFDMATKFEPPVVKVNGIIFRNKEIFIDTVNSKINSDRMISNKVQTSIGILMNRTIHQFSQQYHDNYIISDYIFKNTNLKTVTGVYFYFIYRWAVNAETRFVIGNATGWGINTMLDSRGDGQNPASTFFPGNKDNDIRAVYGWHGKSPSFVGGYDNVGGPVWAPYYEKSDTIGRLAASQFVGIATLHADKSPKDSSDDIGQPSTISYESSDGTNMTPNDQYNSSRMTNEYGMISKGRLSKRHADSVGKNGDPALGTGGGQSATLGYGPYTIATGDSIRIVLVEAADGLSQEAAISIGKKYKAGLISAQQKNDSVYTGRDSLFKTFRRAMANYQSGYNIPQPPLPPKTFSVTQTATSKIKLEWTIYTDNDPKLKGFDIYRSSDSYYGSYGKIFSCNSEIRSYTDSLLIPGTKYYYYIVSIGNADDNDGIGMTPPGALQSNRYYTQTYDAIYGPTLVGYEKLLPTEFSLSQNYPNPFNPSTTINYTIPTSEHINIRVFDMLGREIAVLVNDYKQKGRYSVEFDASNISSGMYIYRLYSERFSDVKKLIIVK
jgi:hypothetical protein